ncbi:MAG: hypothetical protein ACW98A_10290 [Candidatus Hodarchaeales archaeon]|jgi:hypothetical protein
MDIFKIEIGFKKQNNLAIIKYNLDNGSYALGSIMNVTIPDTIKNESGFNNMRFKLHISNSKFYIFEETRTFFTYQLNSTLSKWNKWTRINQNGSLTINDNIPIGYTINEDPNTFENYIQWYFINTSSINISIDEFKNFSELNTTQDILDENPKFYCFICEINVVKSFEITDGLNFDLIITNGKQIEIF